MIGSGQLLKTGDDNDDTPRAYINYILFDDNFILQDFDFKRVTEAGHKTGTAAAHDKLELATIVSKPGYLYIYLSNENDKIVDVFFDDLKITHHHSPIVQAADYYPFGLTFNSYQRTNSAEQRYLYNQGAGEKKFDTERISDIGLNLDFTKFRLYDYQTGRFTSVDPLADAIPQESLTPYQFGYNNPIRYNDPYGDCVTCIIDLKVKYSALMSFVKSNSSQGEVTRLMTGSSETIQQKTGSNSPVALSDTKAMAVMGDAKIISDNVAKNTKILANEVSKDGLAATQAVGTGIEIIGMGTPVSGVGAAINATAGVLDEARQVAFEEKSGVDALVDTGLRLAIDKTFSKLGDAAKSTVVGAEKQTHDKIVSAYEFSFTNLFQWVSDMITDYSREKDKKK